MCLEDSRMMKFRKHPKGGEYLSEREAKKLIGLKGPVTSADRKSQLYYTKIVDVVVLNDYAALILILDDRNTTMISQHYANKLFSLPENSNT